jgi:hypothetical protein
VAAANADGGGDAGDALGDGELPASGEPQALSRIPAMSTIDLMSPWSRRVREQSSNLPRR